MKKLTLITAVTLVLASYSFSAATSAEQAPVEEPDHSSQFIDFLIEYKEEQTLLEEQHAEFQAAQIRAEAISQRIYALEQYVDKTWYVFSGSTPEGWDCSGMVRWFYLDLQVELEHSATAQKFSGEIIQEPIPGDIVAFSHHGTKAAYHNGIYIGNGLFIHSPRPGTQTRVSSVDNYMNGNSKVSYTRINF
jgi:cell wall-associated NlpC family hydrolase